MADKVSNLTWKLGVLNNTGDGFNKAASDAESMTSRIGGALGKLGNTIGGEFGEIVNKVGEGFEKLSSAGSGTWSKLAAGGAIAAGVGFALQSLASHGQQAEAQLKVAVDNAGDSFEDFDKQIQQAEASGAKFGDTNAEVAAALQTLVQATGDTAESIKLLGTAYDLAAAKHESLNDAAQQLAKIYNGSGGKILKSLGIDATVTAGNMTEAKNAIAQVAQVVQGQAAASVDNFNGKVNEAKATIEDWGDKLAGLIGGPLAGISSAATIAGAGMQFFHHRADEAAKSADALQKAGEDAAADSGFGGFLKKLGPVGLGLGAVGLAAGVAGVALSLFGGSGKKAAEPIQDLTTTLQANAGAFNAQSRAAIVASAQSQGLFSAGEKVKATGVSAATLTDGLNGNAAAYDRVVTSLKATIAANTGLSGTRAGTYDTLNATGKAAQDLLTKYEGLHGQVQASIDDAKQQTAAEAGAADESKKLADVLSALTNQTDSYSNALKTLTGGAVDAATANNQFLDSIDSVTSSVKDNGRSLDVGTAAGRKNNEAVLTAITNAQKHAEAVQKQTGSIDQANQALQTDEDAIRKAAAAAGLNKQQIDQMIKSYGGLPGDVKLTLDTNFESQLSTLNILSDKFAALNGAHAAGTISLTEYTITSNDLHAQAKQSASGGVLSHADGGYVNTFDEAGGEMFRVPDGTEVIPHNRTMDSLRGMRSGGGGDTHTYYITISALDPKAAANAVADALTQAVNSGGRRLPISKGIY